MNPDGRGGRICFDKVSCSYNNSFRGVPGAFHLR